MSFELKPCECLSKKLAIEHLKINEQLMYKVVCSTCGRSGTHSSLKEGSIIAWNSDRSEYSPGSQAEVARLNAENADLLRHINWGTNLFNDNIHFIHFHKESVADWIKTAKKDFL